MESEVVKDEEDERPNVFRNRVQSAGNMMPELSETIKRNYVTFDQR